MPDIFGLRALTQNKTKHLLNGLDDDARSQRTDSPDLHIRRSILYFVKNAQCIQNAKHGTFHNDKHQRELQMTNENVARTGFYLYLWLSKDLTCSLS
jgi:hypothetical protein